MEAKILVVEDEVIVARTIASQLMQLGYTVVGTASSGAAAIDKVNRTEPDLVLMDVMLKGEMDGITAASQICSQHDIPIVFLTAYADENTLQRAKNTLPLGYIVKPFNSGELRVAVELALFKHQVEKELRTNRSYLATLLHSMNDAVIATDEQGLITFMNPAAEDLTGWREAEASGKDITEVFRLVDEVTDLPVEHPVTQVLQTQEVAFLKEFTALINRNGDRIPIGDSASPLYRQLEGIGGVVVVFWDMSAYRQSELLQKALETEQELNQLKSQFISTVSHEFRNPLAVIRTAAELLDLRGGGMFDDRMRGYIQRIRDSVEQMNQLMEDVLIMGRVEAERLPFNPAPIDLQQLCQDLLEECSLNLSDSHEIVFTYSGDALETRMDETLLRLILSNLLNNAIKYSPTGGRVHLDYTYVLDQQTIVFKVQDQGIGIPQSEQAQLFESFFRASNAQLLQGTGLGLAIAKRCVELHQGQIEVTSELDIGTTFTVILPYAPKV
ncbi:response regulator [Leptolyngbya sp. FACHB-671]|uniref:hybrid sensor histidine kinase/response regulator n=1 Tax=Leptolyngbya sp. FACHB-671 TaxID=2692812 RepID=UPI001683818B|nr:ATP-binding protein [Leptolyngbya sp. FACHB-671]MBD2071809.1 response regulator [Leptolyngbya sp. FACHB-671]